MTRRPVALLLVLGSLALGCGEEPTGERLGAPTAPRASWIFEPPRIGVGQVLVGQAGHGADEGLRIAAHLEGIFVGFAPPPA